MKIFQVDAFTDKPFAGNPAAVCILPAPADDVWMGNLAREMNLSETAFLVRREDGFDLRWFTPAVEVDICGHATLASAHILFESGILQPGRIARFHTRSGLLTAEKKGDRIELDFPSKPVRPADPPDGLSEAIGAIPLYTGKSRFDYLLEVESEAIVRSLSPDFGRIRKLPVRGVIVTSRASTVGYDFVSRFFAPAAGVDEDPVTGSAHCSLGPYWRKKLEKDRLVAFQASRRGGEIHVTLSGDRIKLGGKAVTVLEMKLLPRALF